SRAHRERGQRMQFALTASQTIDDAAAVHRSERDRLVQAHLPLVRTIAGAVRSSTIGAGIPLDDLVAYGANGLLDAADRFDPARGAPFAVFCRYSARSDTLYGHRSDTC